MNLKSQNLFIVILLLLSRCSSNNQIDSRTNTTSIEEVVNEFFGWYTAVIREGDQIEYAPVFLEAENGKTTLMFWKYLNNLRQHHFSESLIEEEKRSYDECITHLEKVDYLEFSSTWNDLDDFETTNCDFTNSYRWTGGMEPVECIRIVSSEVVSELIAIVHLKYCRFDSEGIEKLWGSRTVKLEKQGESWQINEIN